MTIILLSRTMKLVRNDEKYFMVTQQYCYWKLKKNYQVTKSFHLTFNQIYPDGR